MSERVDPRAAFEQIVRTNIYMILATADASGRPWSTPVWFATADCREFFWVSSPQARHSRSLADRPELAIAIFDSHQPPGTGRGVYLAGTGAEVADAELERGLAVFSAASREQGGKEWTRSDTTAPAKHRLYHAVTSEHFVLDEHDERIRVSP